MLKTSLGNRAYAQDTIGSVLATLEGDTHDRVALGILTRLRRTYNLMILDGQEYILVPATKKEMT